MRLKAPVFVVLVLVLAAPAPAWAYIDPGTSSIAYQVILAGVLAVGFAIRRAWSRVAAALKLRHSSRPPNGSASPE